MDAVPIDRDRGELVSIVYTSGSTGQPKGIMMGREQLNRLFRRLPEYRVPHGTRLGAPTAGTVTFAEMIIGSAMVMQGTLVAYEIRRHGLGLMGAWFQKSGVRACYMVPTILRYLMLSLPPDFKAPSLDTVILSGETATWEDVTQLRRLLREDAVIVNGFGQSETVSIATMIIPGDMPAGEGPLPAGHPSPDLDVAILDLDGQPVPAGERGEIVVQGHYLSLGYWRRPELTRATYSELPDGRRQVRTRDAGRILPDGTLEHLGRLDHLVKIAGNRVELGEVEIALSRLEGVAAAAAGTYTDAAGGTRLAACVVPSAGAKLDPRLLRISLTRRLPGYMLPDRIAVTDALPQLPGGKVDRAQIATIDGPAAPAGEVGQGADSELERALESIWREILDVARIDRDDDFFELGGDSMRAARMFVELERRLGIDRPVSLLAEAPTIASLALVLESGELVADLPLAVQTQGTRPPLFVIHDGFGNVLYARGLAGALGDDQPIYGLRSPILSGAPLTARSVEEVAERYIERIQALYPHGPYLFYGASMGGMIAMEMARQLLLNDEAVPLVVLGDTEAPGPHMRRRTLDELTYHRRNLSPLNSEQRARYVIDVLMEKLVWVLGTEGRAQRRDHRELTRRLSRNEPIPASLRALQMLQEYGQLLIPYRPRAPIPDRTLLIRAKGSHPRHRGWDALLGSTLEIVDAPRSHNELCREAAGPYVGPVIRQRLDRLAGARSEVTVPA